MATVLIIDDEENIRKTLREILEDEAHTVLAAKDGEEGVRVFRQEAPDVVLLDIKLPRTDGIEVLREIKAINAGAEVIMISGHGTIDLAVTAIKQGAYHFLQKPLSMLEVKQNVRHAADLCRQRSELRTLKERDDGRYRIVGKSRAIGKVREEIAKVAPTQGRVLVTGPSGSGKELVAFAIHKDSRRASGPFVRMNCAAIPQNLIESELFGYEKGAFTGAQAQKKGKFETAHNGTLLLDEIGDMDLNTQTKVLRAIQEGEFERVGGTRTIRVDVRIIAATHRDLEAMIREGAFREDLFYRLAVLLIHVPSLNERPEDITELAGYFLESYCRENGMPEKRFSPEALGLLARQDYPGNIRQLKNIVERAAILCGEPVISAAFTETVTRTKESRGNALFTLPRTLQQAQFDLEKEYVTVQLEQNGWDIGKTAEILGLHRTNLYRKMRQLGIGK